MKVATCFLINTIHKQLGGNKKRLTILQYEHHTRHIKNRFSKVLPPVKNKNGNGKKHNMCIKSLTELTIYFSKRVTTC